MQNRVCVPVCLLRCYLPLWPLCTVVGCRVWNPQRDYPRCIRLNYHLLSHLGFCSPIWQQQQKWLHLYSPLLPSLNRTSGRLKKLPFVIPNKDCLIVWKSYIECWATGERAKVHSASPGHLFCYLVFPVWTWKQTVHGLGLRRREV